MEEIGGYRGKDDFSKGKGESQIAKSKSTEGELPIPFEVLQIVLSNLNNLDLKACKSVSRQWNKATVEIARQNQAARVNEFVQYLTEKIDAEKNPAAAERLNKLKEMSSNSFLGSVTLLQIKNSSNDIKEEIYDILFSLDNEQLKNLEMKEFPPFFRDILSHIDFDKKEFLRAANASNEIEKIQILSPLITSLGKAGHLKTAYSVANLIDSGELPERGEGLHQSFMDIILQLLNKKEINRATTVFNKLIEYDIIKNPTLSPDKWPFPDNITNISSCKASFASLLYMLGHRDKANEILKSLE